MLRLVPWMGFGWLRRLLGLLAVAGFLATAFTPLANALAPCAAPADPGTAGAIVVLGSAVDKQGVLNDSSLRRALYGILLQRRGRAPLLVLLGPPQDGSPAEADVRAGLARELGVASEAILTETRTRTTREEAERVRDLLLQRGVRRILLVTHPLHLPRAHRVFAQAGFDVIPAPVADGSCRADSGEERLKLMRRLLQEVVARAYYRMAGGS